jgi:hypothetical protein
MNTVALSRKTWWVAGAFGRNPLLRRTDRIEALIIVFAVTVAVAALLGAAAVGAGVYGSRYRLYADEAQTRHTVTATVVEADASTSKPHATASQVRATWRVGEDERTDWFRTDNTVKAGDHIDIWVNDYGDHMMPPTPTSQAAVDAVGVGLGIWLAVAIAMTALVGAARTPLNRIRHAQWEREMKSLAGGGRTNRPQ